MTSFWNPALEAAGLTATAPAPVTITGDCWITPLLEQQLLRLHGADAEKFLQGQVTCNLGQLSPEQSLLGANCTPKGNVISAFRLLQRAPGELLLRVNRANSAATQANLGKYMVFSKAELDDLSDSYAGIGIGGPQAAALLERLLGNAPQAEGGVTQAGDALLIQVAGAQPRFELWAPQAELQSLWEALRADAKVVAPRHWQAEEIRAGLVQLSDDSVDSYLPHMLNLQAVNGISFTKGCYIGQEVVARLQYRGKLKKHLYAAQVAGEAAVGSGLHSPDRSSVGKVIAVAPVADGSTLIQAIINKGEADKNQLRLDTPDGTPVTLLELPYSIDPALFERG